VSATPIAAVSDPIPDAPALPANITQHSHERSVYRHPPNIPERPTFHRPQHIGSDNDDKGNEIEHLTDRLLTAVSRCRPRLVPPVGSSPELLCAHERWERASIPCSPRCAQDRPDSSESQPIMRGRGPINFGRVTTAWNLLSRRDRPKGGRAKAARQRLRSPSPCRQATSARFARRETAMPATTRRPGSHRQTKRQCGEERAALL
jgi:hypothetical protein